MKLFVRSVLGIASLCMLLFVVMQVIPLPIKASFLTENPKEIRLKGVDRSRQVHGEILWDSVKIRLRGFNTQASVSGTFTDSADILDQLINPESTTTVVDKSKIKVFLMTNSQLACQGVAEGLECAGKIRMQVDTFLGKIKNTLTLRSLSRSELADNQITLSHRITEGDGVPSLILDVLNKELAAKDRTRALPPFFTEHNVEIVDHSFVGNSIDDTLGVKLTLKMSLSDLISAIF
jgi:hypothetical protein